MFCFRTLHTVHLKQNKTFESVLRLNFSSDNSALRQNLWDFKICLILDTYDMIFDAVVVFSLFFYFLFKSWCQYCALLSKRARRRTLWQFLNELIFLFLVSQWSLVPPLRTLARISHRLCSLARGLMDMSKIAKIRTNGMGFNGLYLLSLLSSKIVM